jgi:hypothetical protein
MATSTLEKLTQLEDKIETIREHDPLYEIDKEIEEVKHLVDTNQPDQAEKEYAKTERLVERVLALDAEKGLAVQLLRVELAYLVVLLCVGYLAHMNPSYWLWKGLTGPNAATAWFGSLGGVTIAIFGLYTHVQVRDFDPSYKLWYLCKPVIGAIFGWFVAFVYFIGLVAVQGNSTSPTNPQLLYVIAFLAGFSERFTVKIVDRIMQVLMTWEEKPANGSSAVPQTK